MTHTGNSSNATITFTPEGGGKPSTITLAKGETVLDGLLRHGVPATNSCRAGACQSCMMKVTSGTPPPRSQKGLKDSLRAQGFFLPCVCEPAADLEICGAGEIVGRARAVVRKVEKLNVDVARVLLSCETPFEYFPGQYINLVRADGLTRSYSLASLHSPAGLPEGDDHLELHVRKVAGGRMSTWLHDEARSGESIEVRGPQGDCFYVAGHPEQPILLVGTGTGLCPLYAIARDALRQHHTGPIHLYHGAVEARGLYLTQELQGIAKRHPNFNYHPCVLIDRAGEPIRVGSIDRVVFDDHPKLAGWRVFLCGAPGLVDSLRKKVYLAGARLKDIHADAFVMRATA